MNSTICARTCKGHGLVRLCALTCIGVSAHAHALRMLIVSGPIGIIARIPVANL